MQGNKTSKEYADSLISKTAKDKESRPGTVVSPLTGNEFVSNTQDHRKQASGDEVLASQNTGGARSSANV